MKKKNKRITIFIVLLILAVITTILVEGSLAKYASKNIATATATAAKWEFKVRINSTDSQTIDLASTIPANTYDLASGVIAPGTSGEFKIVLDATGCQVGVDYTISFEGLTAEGMPSGLTITPKTAGKDTGTIQYSTTASNMKVEIPFTWSWALGSVNADGTGTDNTYQGQTFNGIKAIVTGVQSIQ